MASARFEIAEAGRTATAEVDAPAAVVVELTPQGRERLAELDCVVEPETARVDAWIVGGTLDEAELIVTHGACDPVRLAWDPAALGLVVPAGS